MPRLQAAPGQPFLRLAVADQIDDQTGDPTGDLTGDQTGDQTFISSRTCHTVKVRPVLSLVTMRPGVMDRLPLP